MNFDDLMVVAAFRYCLGRRTYIVSHCVDWCIKNWDKFEERSRICIKRDLQSEIESDDRSRANPNRDWYPLGDNCDREQWIKLMSFIQKYDENKNDN